MDLKLKDKLAFISGSTSGIGLATARRLLAEGARVVINGRTEQSVQAALDHLKESLPEAEVSGIAADFAKVTDVDRLLAALPAVDILINNVGIFEPKPFSQIPDDDWFRFFEVNVMSGIRLARVYFPGMLEKNWGRILFISSE